MTRGQYLARRLVQMIPVLLGITFIVFLLIHAIPGDPAVTMLGIHARPESIAALRHQLGLDKPLWEQYFIYLRNVIHLDLGDSLKYKVPVSELIQQRMVVTLFLIAFSTVLMIVISLPLGITAAIKKDSIFDQIVRAVLMVTMV